MRMKIWVSDEYKGDGCDDYLMLWIMWYPTIFMEDLWNDISENNVE